MARSRIGGRGTKTGRGMTRAKQTRLAASKRRQAGDRARLHVAAPMYRHPARGGVAR